MFFGVKSLRKSIVWKVVWKEICNLNNLFGGVNSATTILSTMSMPNLQNWAKMRNEHFFNLNMDSTMGLSPWSILFHFENQWPSVSLWHRLQMCPLRDGRVGMLGYDSMQVVHVCMIHKASIYLQTLCRKIE